MATWELIKEMGENGFYVGKEWGVFKPTFFKVKITDIAIYKLGDVEHTDIRYESLKEEKVPHWDGYGYRIMTGSVSPSMYKKTFWLKEDKSE